MQLGVISDIHGNARALEQVWQKLAALGVTDRSIFNAGDHVGYGDDPEGCVRFLRAHPQIVSVQGNYDRHVANFPEKQAELFRKWGKSRPEKYRAIEQDSSAISDESRVWLRDLPREQELTVEGVKIVLTHYSPGSKAGLGTWTPTRHLEELAGQTDAEVVICGHTHTPFVRRAGGVLWVNPGTVGRSWHRRASFAILDLEPGEAPSATLHQGSVS